MSLIQHYTVGVPRKRLMKELHSAAEEAGAELIDRGNRAELIYAGTSRKGSRRAGTMNSSLSVWIGEEQSVCHVSAFYGTAGGWALMGAFLVAVIAGAVGYGATAAQLAAVAGGLVLLALVVTLLTLRMGRNQRRLEKELLEQAIAACGNNGKRRR